MVEPGSSEHGDEAENACPAMGGVFFTSSVPPSGLYPRREEDDVSVNISPASFIHDISINAKTPPSPRMEELLGGLNEPGDSGNTPDPPSWLDRQLFYRGRQFYKRYLFCMSFSDLLALVAIFSMPRSVKPLIHTTKSDTPEKALQRYFSTLLHVITWYTGDVWNPNDPAHKDVLSIRSIHDKYARLFNSSNNNEKVTNVLVSEKGHKEPQCPLYTSIQMDIKPQVEDKFNLMNSNCPPHYISQFDMSMTQYAFMGLLVSHPKKVGAGAATEEDLEGLIHFWRGIGWLLGIEDKYNFCNGNVAETRALCQETEQLIIVPSLAAADWNYEHMATCLISGMNIIVPGLSFPAMFRYLADLMEVRVPNFANQMSFLHTLHYWTLRIVFSIIIIFPRLILILNSMFEYLIIKHQNQLSKSKTTFKNLDLKESYN